MESDPEKFTFDNVTCSFLFPFHSPRVNRSDNYVSGSDYYSVRDIWSSDLGESRLLRRARTSASALEKADTSRVRGLSHVIIFHVHRDQLLHNIAVYRPALLACTRAKSTPAGGKYCTADG